jgi:hypothetical protein
MGLYMGSANRRSVAKALLFRRSSVDRNETLTRSTCSKPTPSALSSGVSGPSRRRKKRKRRQDPAHDHAAVPSERGRRVGRGRGAPRVTALLHVNEPRRPQDAAVADARVRLARGEPHLHVRRPAQGAVVVVVIDVDREDVRPACRRGRRGRRDVLAEPIEGVERVDVSRGLDAVAQEHIRLAGGIPVELEMPRGRVARVDLLERNLEDRLRRM